MKQADSGLKRLLADVLASSPLLRFDMWGDELDNHMEQLRLMLQLEEAKWNSFN